MTLVPVRFWIRMAIVAGLLVAPFARTALAATVSVPGNYPTIQAAINAAPSGTTIEVQPGVYFEALVVDQATGAKSLTIRGVGGAGATIVDATGKGSAALTVYRATAPIVFVGLTFRKGAPGVAAGGGFVITESSPSFFDCVFELNTALGNGGGGGALITSNATFSGCIIRNNSARHSGGGVLILANSHPVFTNCDIVSNVSGTNAFDGVGGGIDSRDSSPTFRGSRIKSNAAKFAGGGIYHGGHFGSPYGTSLLVIEDSEVADNTSSPFSSAYNPGEGGGIHIEDNAIATLTRARILRNIANTGGGLNAYRARYDIVDSVIDANEARARTDGGIPGGMGGGINAMSSNAPPSSGPVSVVNLTGTLVRNNIGVTGGGIVVTGDTNLQATLTLASSVVDRNQSQNQGGGILVSHAALTATNSMIIRNSVAGGGSGAVGGGIDVTTFSAANISGTTIAHNNAGTFGGGIFVFDGSNTLNMSTSNVYENTAGVRGGGLFIGGASQSGTIQNSTIADNNGSAQVNEEGCTAVVYQNNTITPKSGGTQFSGCTPPGSRQTGTNTNVPRFNRFLAAPRAGTSTTLAWSVARATSVTIAGVGTWNSPNNSPTGTVDVTPTSSTTYSLTATAASGNGGHYNTPVTAGFTSVQPPPPPPPPPTGDAVDGDFDGDGKSDIAVYRPSNGAWYLLKSNTGFTGGETHVWGGGNDVPVPGDYDGDGRIDIAIYRPSTGHWFILKSSTNYSTWDTHQWGSTGDKLVPSDYDGDGRTDIAVYRPSNGTWYILTSSSGFSSGAGYAWGAGNDVPVPGDYDGDGKAEVAVYRPSTGHWFLLKSSTNYTVWDTYQWGSTGDIQVPGDFDGDGKIDPAVYRPSNGTWYVLRSSSGFTAGAGYAWGAAGDIPVPGDYDGDGKTDVAIYRTSTAHWFILRSSTNYTTWGTYQWGSTGDIPVLRRP